MLPPLMLLLLLLLKLIFTTRLMTLGKMMSSLDGRRPRVFVQHPPVIRRGVHLLRHRRVVPLGGGLPHAAHVPLLRRALRLRPLGGQRTAAAQRTTAAAAAVHPAVLPLPRPPRLPALAFFSSRSRASSGGCPQGRD